MALNVRRNVQIDAFGRIVLFATMIVAVTVIAPVFDPALAQGPHCTALLDDKSRAMNGSDHKKIISTTRTLLGQCHRELQALDFYGSHLADLALALWQDNQAGEGLAVAERCLQLKTDGYVACLVSKGAALSGLKRFEESRQTLSRALREPSLTSLDESSKRLARSILLELPLSGPISKPSLPRFEHQLGVTALRSLSVIARSSQILTSYEIVNESKCETARHFKTFVRIKDLISLCCESKELEVSRLLLSETDNQ